MYSAWYTVTDLGPVPGLPGQSGGMAFFWREKQIRCWWPRIQEIPPDSLNPVMWPPASRTTPILSMRDRRNQGGQHECWEWEAWDLRQPVSPVPDP
jgi:hypothetical protein